MKKITVKTLALSTVLVCALSTNLHAQSYRSMEKRQEARNNPYIAYKDDQRDYSFNNPNRNTPWDKNNRINNFGHNPNGGYMNDKDKNKHNKHDKNRGHKSKNKRSCH